MRHTSGTEAQKVAGKADGPCWRRLRGQNAQCLCHHPRRLARPRLNQNPFKIQGHYQPANSAAARVANRRATLRRRKERERTDGRTGGRAEWSGTERNGVE